MPVATDEQSWSTSVFLRGVEFFRREFNDEMLIQQVSIFLEVANNPGITMTEIQERLHLSQANVSRHVKRMSRYAAKEDGETVMRGFNLVTTTRDPFERRRLALHLTPKGKEVYSRFKAFLSSEGVN